MHDESPIPILTCPPAPPWMDRAHRPFFADLFALFSSEFEGIITEPLFMRVPIDDHLVHRGDGVFETLKCVAGRIICLEEHLERLFFSAAKTGLDAPTPREGIRHRILETLRAGGRRDGLIRVLLSRGPGSMGISPYDCPRAHLYILVHKLPPSFMDAHPEGARLVTSSIPVKAGVFATIKTCNYLPNALLKKEAVDRGADFSVNFDESGFVAEGATENIGIITPDRRLVIPRPERILTGTTMNRAFALAEAGLSEGWLTGKARDNITREALHGAPEVLIFGTTTNVTSVTRLDGQPVGTGLPGPVYRRLSERLLDEHRSDNPHTTRAFT